MIEILQGDCLSVLKTLPDDSVQMCVTSPPYYGLRDYGTGQWEGGDPDCDHRHQLGGEGKSSAIQNNNHGSQAIAYRNTCGKCGATRIDQQIGLESSVDAYVARLVEVFREVRRVLKMDGTCWVNLGDSFASGQKGSGGPSAKQLSNSGSIYKVRSFDLADMGLKPKDLIGVPWRCAFALQADGWILRCDIIWEKPNCMPSSVKDRPTRSHEYIFLLSKSPQYYFNHEAIKEPCLSPVRTREKGNGESAVDTKKRGFGSHCGTYEARHRRSVWTVNTCGFPGAHFATFPPKLIEPCILAGSRSGDVVLDPFFGSGTTALVARQHGRRCIGIELNADYIQIAQRRLGLAADPLEEEASYPSMSQPGLFEAIPA